MPHLAGSSLNGKCFSDVSRAQRVRLLPLGRVLSCPTIAFHAGRDRRAELKSQGPYGCIEMDVFSCCCSCPGAPEWCETPAFETRISSCYPKESLVPNILDYLADVARNIITLTKGGRDVE